jgi:hypothetical protein
MRDSRRNTPLLSRFASRSIGSPVNHLRTFVSSTAEKPIHFRNGGTDRFRPWAIRSIHFMDHLQHNDSTRFHASFGADAQDRATPCVADYTWARMRPGSGTALKDLFRTPCRRWTSRASIPPLSSGGFRASTSVPTAAIARFGNPSVSDGLFATACTTRYNSGSHVRRGAGQTCGGLIRRNAGGKDAGGSVASLFQRNRAHHAG